MIKDETDGKGVDVILDMVGGDYIQRNMEAAALWGRIVNIAYQDGARAEVNFTPMLMQAADAGGDHLARPQPWPRKRAIRDALRARSGRWWRQGAIRPVVDQAFPLAEAQKAHEIMAKTGQIGKILLIPLS